MKRILVTGGAGFIGSHVAEALAAEGWRVRLTDMRPSSWPLPAGAEFRVADLTDAAAVADLVDGCAGIIHLAAISRVSTALENPLGCIDANIMGTACLLDAARRIAQEARPWLIAASSREVGSTAATLYGITKSCAEMTALWYADTFGLKVLNVRFGDVYGSDRDHPNKVLPIFVRRALGGETITVNAAGARFDFVHVDDLVRGLGLAVRHLEHTAKADRGPVTLCTGVTTTLGELARLVVAEAGSRSEVILKEEASGDEGAIANDTRAAKTILGFEAAVSLPEGIGRLVARHSVPEVKSA